MYSIITYSHHDIIYGLMYDILVVCLRRLMNQYRFKMTETNIFEEQACLMMSQ